MHIHHNITTTRQLEKQLGELNKLAKTSFTRALIIPI